MAKLTAIKNIKKDNQTIIAGYKVALRKLEMERCGFQEGDELDVKYHKDKVVIVKK